MVNPDRSLPQAAEAEQAVLGAMLLSPRAIVEAREILSGQEFYQPRHQAIWQAICRMVEAGKAPDGVTILAELLACGDIGKVGGAPYIHTLVSMVPTASNVGWYADEVRKTARRRKAIEIGQRLTQAAYEVLDDDSWLDTVASQSLAVELMLDEKASTEPVAGLTTWSEFIAQNTGVKREWVCPDLVARQDVWMVLSPPGGGKTTLSRQLCWCLAAGIHPFHPAQRIPPQRTLLVDLEVDPSTAAEESTIPLAQVRRLGDFADDRAHIWSRIEGLNLRRREDVQLFQRVLDETRPTFVALGSLYKTGVQAKGGESYEVAAMEVRDVFDKLRRRWRFALWLEHHMPKDSAGGRKPNPFGSSVWEWWPSHGRVLERAGTSPSAPFRFTATFRGDRGKRDVPVGFYRGGRLPWTAITDEAELDLLIGAST
jgi:hypothetical protein